MISVFIAGYSADIAENTHRHTHLDTSLVKHSLLRISCSLAAVRVAHTHTHTYRHTYRHTQCLHLEKLGLHQGRDIWSWRSPVRSSVSGPHSRRGAPRSWRGSGDAVMFSRQLEQEW